MPSCRRQVGHAGDCSTWASVQQVPYTKAPGLSAPHCLHVEPVCKSRFGSAAPAHCNPDSPATKGTLQSKLRSVPSEPYRVLSACRYWACASTAHAPTHYGTSCCRCPALRLPPPAHPAVCRCPAAPPAVRSSLPASPPDCVRPSRPAGTTLCICPSPAAASSSSASSPSAPPGVRLPLPFRAPCRTYLPLPSCAPRRLPLPFGCCLLRLLPSCNPRRLYLPLPSCNPRRQRLTLPPASDRKSVR